jgi:hypothetical protein
MYNIYMPILTLNPTQLVKKNIFLDSKVWSVASDNAKAKNISVAQEIRNKLAQVYNQSIAEQDNNYISDRAKQRRELAGSITSVPNSDIDGAINHNDIYSI